MAVKEINEILRRLANPEIAQHSQRFFKTGVGEYGDEDRDVWFRPVIYSISC